MDAEHLRSFLLKLPHVVDTVQWSNNLVFWVGDKAIGGKMFALVNLDGGDRGVISYAATPEHYAELLEIEGIRPAPYLARLSWAAIEDWQVFRTREWEDELRAAYDLTLAKLPPKVHAILQLPARQQQKVIAERREILKAKAAAAKTSPDSRQTTLGKKAGTRRAEKAPKP
jgi:predicted DNA-binding protein (MmcQ/YjbR family)